jgi:hypothetical protein
MKQVREFTGRNRAGEVIRLQIEVDWHALAGLMVVRAASNSRGKTIALRGAIKAKLLSKIAPENSVD